MIKVIFVTVKKFASNGGDNVLMKGSMLHFMICGLCRDVLYDGIGLLNTGKSYSI